MADNLPNASLFSRFLESGDTLRVYHDGELIFSSREDGIAPLVTYITDFGCYIMVFCVVLVKTRRQ